TSRVWPSGSARATACAPMFPLAPERFSTTNGWPSRCCNRSARRRASVSVPPPGGNVTTSVTGPAGQGRGTGVSECPLRATPTTAAAISVTAATTLQRCQTLCLPMARIRHDVQSDIQYRHTVCDGANGDVVHPRLGHGDRRVRSHAARRLSDRTTIYQAYGLAKHLRRHVVQEHDIHASVLFFCELLHRVYFQLNSDHIACSLLRPFHGCTHTAGDGHMVVPDQHGIVQSIAMIAASADPHCVLLHHTKAGQRLARASDACAIGANGIRNPGCCRRHAAQMPQEVQGCSF